MYPFVKRALPLWLAAVVPTTLAAHGLAYVLSGRNATGGVHAWVLPTLEASTAFLAGWCSTLFAGALLRAGVLRHTAAERSVLALWARLSFAQVALYVAMESFEGSHAAVFGCAVQLAAALLVAYLLSLFSFALERYAGCAAFILRLFDNFARRCILVALHAVSPARALAIVAGTARFQRPPPVSIRLFL